MCDDTIVLRSEAATYVTVERKRVRFTKKEGDNQEEGY